MAGRIYTRTGDDGTTGLFGGGRVRKDALRVEAYGEVDELNALLGVVLCQPLPEELARELRRISNWLFVMGADLATPLRSAATVPRIAPAHVRWLEQRIDYYEGRLPELKHFVLPGGHPTAALLHLARTVCRRAERAIVRAAAHEELNAELVRFANRLSDYLFVAARWVNHVFGVEEVPWTAAEPPEQG